MNLSFNPLPPPLKFSNNVYILLLLFTPEQIGNLVGGVPVHGQLVQVAGDIGSLWWKLVHGEFSSFAA